MIMMASAMTPDEEKFSRADVREGMLNEPGLSFNSLANDDLIVKHWTSALTSVFHADKLILTPELRSVNGYVASNYVSETCVYHCCSISNPMTSKL